MFEPSKSSEQGNDVTTGSGKPIVKIEVGSVLDMMSPVEVPLNHLFQVVSQQKYLEINDDFELVTTENRIDRERICPNLFKAGEECTMDASIYTFNARSRKSETYTIR